MRFFPAFFLVLAVAVATPAGAQTAAPLPDADGAVIEPVELDYRSSISINGRELQLDMHRTLAPATYEGAAAWRIVDTTTMPMGTTRDTFYVDRATLMPLYRSAGGMGTMDLTYTPDRVSGTIRGQGQSIAVDADLDAPVIGDGAGMEVYVMGLPLEPGFEAPLHVFTPMLQAGRTLALSVTGTEEITVPAGTFDTYVVSIVPQGGGGEGEVTMYVTQDAPHYVVRGSYRLPPAMGGGEMTTELQ